jgi:hypothetical protein
LLYNKREKAKKEVTTMWTVWGDSSEPVKRDLTEEQAKDYVIANVGTRSDLYVEDEEGNEYEYDEVARKWREAL